MMEDELKKNAADLLALLKDGLEKGAQVAGEQLPDLAMQYVLWGRVMNTVTLVFLTVTAVTCIWVFYQSAVKNRWEVKDSYAGWGHTRAVACTLSGVMGMLFTALALANTSSFLLVWFAPKVWLLKEIAQVLK